MLHTASLLIVSFIMRGLTYSQSILSFKEIYKVDSIAQTQSAASSFANPYIKTMWQIEEQLKNSDSAITNQIRKLELNFSNYFIQACCALNSDKNWDNYFTNTGLSELQLRLLGINAHINGDLWRAIRDSYTAEEIKGMDKTVFLFHQSLLIIYDGVYEEAIQQNRRLKRLNTISLGLSKNYGKHLLIKWRKRQIKIATLYYFNKKKFERNQNRVERKKDRIDELILNQL